MTRARSTLTQVVERAQTEDFMIYAIGLASRGERTLGPGAPFGDGA